MHRLFATSVVGRGPLCDLRINDRRCSTQHAMIRWEGRHWLLHDLGSRNGTWVEGDRVEPQQRVALRPGWRVAFGNPPDLYEVVDLSPAVPGASGPNGARRFAEHGLLTLPDESSPSTFIEQDDEGGWWIHGPDGRTDCASDFNVMVGEERWRIVAPTTTSETTELKVKQRLIDARLTFAVSPDQEHVVIDALCGGVRTRLEPRSHSYLLLLLAKRRLADRAEGHEHAEEGWLTLPDLASMLKVSENEVNVQVFRARRQFRAAEIEGAARVVERTAGRLRIGVTQISMATNLS
ncbi:MAG: FHA domain-containing protein [Myxococcota bacterium]